jgi:hypothetical protein
MFLLSRAQANRSSLRGRQFMSATLTYYPNAFETAMAAEASLALSRQYRKPG